MQEAIEPESIHIEWIRSELTCKLFKFLLHRFRHPHIKDALHQDLDGEQVGIDGFQVTEGLSQLIGFSSNRCPSTDPGWLSSRG